MEVLNILKEKLNTQLKNLEGSRDVAKSKGLFNYLDVFIGRETEVKNILEMIEQLEADYNNGWCLYSVEVPPQPKPNPEFEGKPLELYLVTTKDGRYPFRAFWNGKDFTDGFSKIYPIAWQPLPPVYEPKENSSNETA